MTVPKRVPREGKKAYVLPKSHDASQLRAAGGKKQGSMTSHCGWGSIETANTLENAAIGEAPPAAHKGKRKKKHSDGGRGEVFDYRNSKENGDVLSSRVKKGFLLTVENIGEAPTERTFPQTKERDDVRSILDLKERSSRLHEKKSPYIQLLRQGGSNVQQGIERRKKSLFTEGEIEVEKNRPLA